MSRAEDLTGLMPPSPPCVRVPMRCSRAPASRSGRLATTLVSLTFRADTLTVTDEPNMTASTGHELFSRAGPREISGQHASYWLMGQRIAAASPVHHMVPTATGDQVASLREGWFRAVRASVPGAPATQLSGALLERLVGLISVQRRWTPDRLRAMCRNDSSTTTGVGPHALETSSSAPPRAARHPARVEEAGCRRPPPDCHGPPGE